MTARGKHGVCVLGGGVLYPAPLYSTVDPRSLVQPTVILAGSLDYSGPSVIQTPASTPPFFAIRISEKPGYRISSKNSALFKKKIISGLPNKIN